MLVNIPGSDPPPAASTIRQSRLGIMTDEEYEDIYGEALHCLAEALSVGEPFVDSRGVRVCKVEGALLDDEQVLQRWWGEEIVADIRREYRGWNRPKVRSTRSE